MRVRKDIFFIKIVLIRSTSLFFFRFTDAEMTEETYSGSWPGDGGTVDVLVGDTEKLQIMNRFIKSPHLGTPVVKVDPLKRVKKDFIFNINFLFSTLLPSEKG